jgi:uncharacterized protein
MSSSSTLPTDARSKQSGFTFPMIQQGNQGRVNYVKNNSQRLIRDSLLQIVLSVPGERLGNPAFGCRVRKVQFDPNSEDSTNLIINLLLEAIRLWETRVTVNASDITVSYASDNSGDTTVKIQYSINNPDFTGNSTDVITITV